MSLVTTIGSLYTITEFLTPNKDRVQIKVTTRQRCTVANQSTYYTWYIYYKPYKHKLYRLKGGEQSGADELYKEYITEQQLYEALHNHWQTLNPLRKFNTYELNGEYTKFSVQPIPNDKPIRARYGHISKIFY